MREKMVEQYLVKQVEKLDGKCFKWTCPGQTGVPDRICILPHGQIFFVEVKRPKGGRESAMQKYVHKILKSLNCRVYTLKSYEECDIVLGNEIEIGRKGGSEHGG